MRFLLTLFILGLASPLQAHDSKKIECLKTMATLAAESLITEYDKANSLCFKEGYGHHKPYPDPNLKLQYNSLVKLRFTKKNEKYRPKQYTYCKFDGVGHVYGKYERDMGRVICYVKSKYNRSPHGREDVFFIEKKNLDKEIIPIKWEFK